MPRSRHQLVEAVVRHLRDRDEVDAEVEREDRDDPVAVDELAALVDREHAVAVAVERDPEVEAARRDEPLERGGVGRAAADVDVRAVGLVADRVHRRAEPLERARREARVRAVRAVERDPQPAQVGAEVRRARSRGSASAAPVVCPTSPCSARGGASSSASISSSAASGSLRPRASKNFTPLYSGGLCEAEMTTPRSSGASATAGVGSTPPSTAIAPAEATPRANAASSSGPDAARVPPDEDALGAAPERRRAAEPLDEVGREELADDPANAVGPEVPPRHGGGA